jgi:predicted nucleic acid-binding protein
VPREVRLEYRDPARLPMLGEAVPPGEVLLDTNVFINARAGRGPVMLRTLLEHLPHSFVAAPTLVELAWITGRPDPSHPDTARVLGVQAALLTRIEAATVLVPTEADWRAAGAFAGQVAGARAGGGSMAAIAVDRFELTADALTAMVAARAGCTIITEDRDVGLLAQLHPRVRVIFYRRARPPQPR